MHILVTRPEPDARTFRESLEAAGHRVTIEPLLVIEPCPPAALPLDGITALVATSRNSLRALSAHPDLDLVRTLPLITVGPGTARTAADLGFSDIIAGTATARDLANLIGDRVTVGARLLHIRGNRVAYDLKSDLEARGFAVSEAIVYRSVPTAALSAETGAAIRAGSLDAVVLMSPRTGEIFTDLMHRAGLDDAASALLYVCLSEAVARRLVPLAPKRIEVAAQPNSEEMLALIARKAALSAAKS